MSVGRSYIPGVSKPPGQPILIPGSAYDRKLPVSTPVLLLITLGIIIGIIIFTIIQINKIQPEAVQLPVDTDLYDLSKLVDLEPDGVCCTPPQQLNPTPRWVYSPSNNFTYSTDVTEPAVICQGLTATDLTTCLNYVSDSKGKAKILAHKGITLYYAFSPGQAGSGICASYSTC